MEKGCVLSKSAAVLLGVFFVVVVVAVGLLAGLVGRETCEVEKESGSEAVVVVPTDGAATPTPYPPGPWDNVRLPLSLQPETYDVLLKIDMENFVFSGHVEILMLCNSSATEVIIHSNKLNISKVTFTDDDGSTRDITDFWFHMPNQFLVVPTGKALREGQMYRLYVEFVGPLKDDLAGLYLSQYAGPNGDPIYLATTQMQPTDARKAFPCFDEPAFKANFTTRIVHKSGLSALSNMPIIRNETNTPEAGWTTAYFQPTVRMPTYLLAFIVCDFGYIELTTENGHTLRVWGRKEAIDSGAAAYALDIGNRSLTYLEQYYDVGYPLPKSDMVAVPDFAAGAMENWGLIIYRETALLYNPATDAQSNKKRVATVVVHELAHQWFGNLVTNQWWDDLWLNEGFATYVESFGTGVVEPTWQMKDQFVIDDLQSVFQPDGLGNSHPIYVPVNHPDEINEIFDAISYAKGGSLIYMMVDFLGENTFRKGLTMYLNALAYRNAFHDDLWNYLTKGAIEDNKDGDLPGNNVKTVMDTWTLQMGYPVVSVVTSGNQYAVTQKHFLYDYTANVTDKYGDLGYKWYVPLTYSQGTANLDTPLTQWMAPDDETVTLQSVTPNGNWILVNIDQKNYYRVNYDADNWNKLKDALMSDHTVFKKTDRAGLIDNTFSFARSGDLNITVALDMTKYLAAELDYVPWSAAVGSLAYLTIMLERSKVYGMFKDYYLTRVQNLYEHYGWADQMDDQLNTFAQVTAIGRYCRLGNETCIDEAKRKFAQWKSEADPDTNNPIEADFKTSVYCNAVRYGKVDDYDFVWDRYRYSTNAAEQSKLLLALGCNREPWILSRHLDRCLNSKEVRRQDIRSCIQYVMQNEYGRSLGWDFVRAKWTELQETLGGFSSLSRLIATASEAFNTEFQLQELIDFAAKHPNAGSATRAIEQAIEKTKANIRWMNDNEEVIYNWLQQNM
ncbi:hypothetical protein Bbelb_214420 [Branchiostoma belcheri]|nr:hypothetical protein Bbelb_214420 [Branchiostoma belcheri]